MYLSGWGVDESIKTVVIETVEIGDYAFGALPALESVRIDNCTTIKNRCFYSLQCIKIFIYSKL